MTGFTVRFFEASPRTEELRRMNGGTMGVSAREWAHRALGREQLYRATRTRFNRDYVHYEKW